MQKYLILVLASLSLCAEKRSRSPQHIKQQDIITQEPKAMTTEMDAAFDTATRFVASSPCSLCAQTCNCLADCSDNRAIKTVAVYFRLIAAKIKNS